MNVYEGLIVGTGIEVISLRINRLSLPFIQCPVNFSTKFGCFSCQTAHCFLARVPEPPDIAHEQMQRLSVGATLRM